MTGKMKTKDRRFIAADILLLVLTILPIVCGIVIYILTAAASEGIKIAGAQIYFTLNTPIQPLQVTESQVNSALVIISVFFLCLYLTHGLSEKAETRRQHIAELIVEKTESLVKTNMGEFFDGLCALYSGYYGSVSIFKPSIAFRPVSAYI